MKNKKVIIPLVIVLLAIVAYLVFNQANKENVTVNETTGAPQDGVEVPVIEIEEVRKVTIEEEFPSTILEYEVQDAIHEMSHQKVEAEDKWGFLPMTQERIERLIVVVEENKANFEKPDTYLKILNRWSNNDFSQAHKDHNAIWSLQGGNVGKATGVLTFEEEKAFIKKHFNIEVTDVTSD